MNLFIKYLKQVWVLLFVIILTTAIATVFTTARPLAAAGVIDITLKQIGYSQELNSNSDTNIEQDAVNVFDLNEVGSLITDFFIKNPTSNDSLIDALPYFIAVLLLLSLVAGIFKYLGHALNAYARSLVMRNVRLDLSISLLEMSMEFFDKNKAGEFISRIITDAQAFGQGIVSLTHRILHTLLMIIMYFIFLINTSKILTLGIFIILLAHYSITALLKKPVRKYETKIFQASADLTANLQETFSNIRLIQSFANTDFEISKLDKNIKRSSKAYWQANAIGATEPEARYVLDGLAEGIILFIAVLQLFSGAINIQGFLLYIYVARLILGPLNEFSTYFIWIQRIIASYTRIGEFFGLETQIKEGKKSISDFDTSIDFRNISFKYEEQMVLKDVAFSIKKGETLAIVGSSGSGKSTLLDLMLRFYDPNEGQILIDGQNIKEFKFKYYRNLFGVVPQEVSLLNDSIENNIRYGRTTISDEKLLQASTVANADEFISSLPAGYKTVIGDRGLKLSGGQRQRLSIARAIVTDPEILLFDEATSSLDTESEVKVQNAIERVLKNRTAIVVAHRLSTIKNADKIIVINEGVIEKEGDHEFLISESETYQRLYNAQIT